MISLPTGSWAACPCARWARRRRGREVKASIPAKTTTRTISVMALLDTGPSLRVEQRRARPRDTGRAAPRGFRRGQVEVVPGRRRGDPAARRAGEQPGPDEERLGDLFDRLDLL